MTHYLPLATINRLLLRYAFSIVAIAGVQQGLAQTEVPLTDLSYFKNPAKSWEVVGNVTADLNKANSFSTDKGTGILVNLPDNRNKGADLFTNTEYGDVDLELDYMMAKSSNSGIYLQGRYEIQLLDSWGIKNPKSGDNGGIYERWDESRPEGEKGYGGYAPRQNVSKAPGLWQHLKISFQAPRFNNNGLKIENAKILRLELNGVTLHEDVELLGPTRGSVANDESATGPLRFQGDHGPIAFRNIKVMTFDKPRPEIANVRYSVYKGRYQATANLSKLPPEARGTLPVISANTLSGVPTEFFINYTGTIKVAEAGNYNFNVMVPGGRGLLKVADKLLTPEGRGQRITVNLPAGETPFELLYIKNQDWTNRSLSIGISGPGIREFFIGDVTSAVAQNNADPILVEAPVNTMLRSFMDIPGGTRVVHAINIGSPEQVHYTYDLDKGALVQVWRGNFLDATPMWYSRGDGSSRPLGTVQYFGNPLFTLAKLPSSSTAWVTDTVGSGYKPKGYKVDKMDVPTFRYNLYGAMVEDELRVAANGQGLTRTLTVQNAPSDFYARLGEGDNITEVANNLFLIGDKAYYLQINDSNGNKTVIREINGRKELLIPVQNKISYTILF